MKASEIPYLADWFAISFRWLILFGLAITLTMADKLQGWMIALLALPVTWNLIMSVLAVFNRRLTTHRPLNVGIDLLSAFLIFAASGDVRGPVLWVGILAIAPASIFFELRGAAFTAAVITLLEVGYLYVFQPQLITNLPLLALAGMNLAAGLAMGLVSLPLIKRLRLTYNGLVHRRREAEQRVQVAERNRMHALSDMIATFSATLDYKAALETAMNSSISTMVLNVADSSPLLCGFFLFEDVGLKYIVGRGFTSHEMTIQLPAKSGLLQEALRSGEQRLKVSDSCDDPELSELISLHTCKSVLVLPLIRGMSAYGVLLYAHPDPAFFNEDRNDLLLTFANQAVIAIQNARLYQDLASEKERIVQTQEEAQKKLARDLHDGPTQSVAAIAMRISIARKLLERSPKEAMDELVKIEDLARRTTSEIRHMLFTLRPLVLESEGLLPALIAMAEKLRELYQQRVVVDVDPQVVKALDATRQVVVFYLVEEAVNNARKHAQAAQIDVRLKFITNDRSMAGLEISDNGLGFDINEVMGGYDQRGSLGMINLRERTDMIKGLFKIDSAPGTGTRVRIFIPLTEDAVDRLHGDR
jgi:signal transduction histidine kinase